MRLKLLLSLITCSLFLLGCSGVQFRTPLFEPGRKMSHGPTGLAYNGREFIMVGKANLIYTVSNVELAPYNEESLDAPWGFYKSTGDPIRCERRGIEICGLTWEWGCCGDGYLWAVDATNLEIIRINMRGEVINSLPSPCDNPSGIAFDGHSLWVSDEVESMIYNISMEDGSILKSIKSPVQHPAGLTWSDGIIWVVGMTNYKHNKHYDVGIFGIDTSSGETFGTYKLKYIEKPSSMTWADGRLWVSDFQKNRVFVFKPPKR
ncbi:MAG: hypothetical protein D6828_02920 [Nitrospirae bacterium]|nr:MAG: hypothetical protein D6828_02920 [Nitrospirota bacterium]